MNFDLIKPLVSAAARHVITGLAGALVTVGAVQQDQSAQFVTIATGIAVWAAGYAWSAWQKHKQEASKQTAFKSGAEAQAVASATPLDPKLY